MPSLFLDILRSMLTGFLVSILIGPVGVFTIQHSSEYGWRAGVISILPISLLDITVALLVLLGMPISFFHMFLLPKWITVLLALFLIGYGIKMFRDAATPHVPKHLPWGQNLLTSIAVALANPGLYLGYAAIAVLLSRFLVWPLVPRMAIGVAFWFGTLVWWAGLIALSAAQRNHQRSKMIAQRIASGILLVTAVIILLPPHLLIHYLRLLLKSL